jgi:pimeloyl-ACP methyl ester carboxylesterase
MPLVDRGDCQLWWDAEGDGDPLLLIMGLGYPSAMWYRQLPELAARWRTIRFDNRGTGETGVPPGPYTIETMAEDAVAVLDAAGATTAHVLGASMGGIIAQQLVLEHPVRVRSLILACTGPGGAEMAPPEPEALQMAAARSTMSPEEAAEAAIEFVYAPTTPRASIDEDFAVRLRQPTSPEGYTNQLTAVVTYAGSYARLGEITAPTLVISGRQDRLVNPANAALLAEAIPGARLVMIEDASHILFTDQTVAVTDAIAAFLQSNSSTSIS